jgi:hypothetical protein
VNLWRLCKRWAGLTGILRVFKALASGGLAKLS